MDVLLGQQIILLLLSLFISDPHIPPQDSRILHILNIVKRFLLFTMLLMSFQGKPGGWTEFGGRGEAESFLKPEGPQRAFYL